VYEMQVSDHLATFAIPTAYRAKLAAAQADAHGPNDDVVAKHQQLERQLDNLIPCLCSAMSRRRLFWTSGSGCGRRWRAWLLGKNSTKF